MTEPTQLSLNPHRAPARVLCREPDNQRHHVMRDRRTTGRLGLAPLVRDPTPMPRRSVPSDVAEAPSAESGPARTATSGRSSRFAAWGCQGRGNPHTPARDCHTAPDPGPAHVAAPDPAARPTYRHGLGVRVAASTVWEILKSAGVDPAPRRGTITWASFLRSQAEGIVACDFFTADPLDGTKVYVLAVIEHATRLTRILGSTLHPSGE